MFVCIEGLGQYVALMNGATQVNGLTPLEVRLADCLEGDSCYKGDSTIKGDSSLLQEGDSAARLFSAVQRGPPHRCCPNSTSRLSRAGDASHHMLQQHNHLQHPSTPAAAAAAAAAAATHNSNTPHSEDELDEQQQQQQQQQRQQQLQLQLQLQQQQQQQQQQQTPRIANLRRSYTGSAAASGRD